MRIAESVWPVEMVREELPRFEDVVIPKTELFFRARLVERVDVAIELHLWRRSLVALKRWKLDLLTRDNIELFKREAAATRRLRHRNIVRFLGVVIDPPAMAIVMEFAPRGDLFSHLAKLRAPPTSTPRAPPSRRARAPAASPAAAAGPALAEALLAESSGESLGCPYALEAAERDSAPAARAARCCPTARRALSRCAPRREIARHGVPARHGRHRALRPQVTERVARRALGCQDRRLWRCRARPRAPQLGAGRRRGPTARPPPLAAWISGRGRNDDVDEARDEARGRQHGAAARTAAHMTAHAAPRRRRRGRGRRRRRACAGAVRGRTRQRGRDDDRRRRRRRRRVVARGRRDGAVGAPERGDRPGGRATRSRSVSCSGANHGRRPYLLVPPSELDRRWWRTVAAAARRRRAADAEATRRARAGQRARRRRARRRRRGRPRAVGRHQLVDDRACRERAPADTRHGVAANQREDEERDSAAPLERPHGPRLFEVLGASSPPIESPPPAAGELQSEGAAEPARAQPLIYEARALRSARAHPSVPPVMSLASLPRWRWTTWRRRLSSWDGAVTVRLCRP